MKTLKFTVATQKHCFSRKVAFRIRYALHSGISKRSLPFFSAVQLHIGIPTSGLDFHKMRDVQGFCLACHIFANLLSGKYKWKCMKCGKCFCLEMLLGGEFCTLCIKMYWTKIPCTCVQYIVQWSTFYAALWEHLVDDYCTGLQLHMYLWQSRVKFKCYFVAYFNCITMFEVPIAELLLALLAQL